MENESDNLNAIKVIGVYYYYLNIVNKDNENAYEKAYSYLLKGVEMNDESSMYYYAELLMDDKFNRYTVIDMIVKQLKQRINK